MELRKHNEGSLTLKHCVSKQKEVPNKSESFSKPKEYQPYK